MLCGGLLGIQAVYVVIGVILILAAIAGYAFIREPEIFHNGPKAPVRGH